MAYVEMKTVLAMVLQRFRLRLGTYCPPLAPGFTQIVTFRKLRFLSIRFLVTPSNFAHCAAATLSLCVLAVPGHKVSMKASVCASMSRGTSFTSVVNALELDVEQLA
jgi:hypothetical protein